LAALSAIQGELLFAVLTIGIGIVMERWYVSWWSVGINILSLVVGLTTLDLAPTAMGLLVAYTFLGFLSAWRRWRGAYFLFGSKTYGALMLALGGLQYPPLSTLIMDFATSLSIRFADPTSFLVFSWGIWFFVAHLIGFVYNAVGPQRQFGAAGLIH